MILEKESEIKTLRNFCENPFNYFSIAELSQKIKLSRNWIYQIINKFEKYSILEHSGKKYKLDFTNPFCKRLKLLFDIEFTAQLGKETKNKILSILNKIIFENSPKSIILTGSVAAQKQKEESDIDFLVISENKNIPYFENTNIILLNEQETKDKYMKGDDFIISALTYGKILHDNNTIIKFLESALPIFSEELIQEKIRYCEKLRERIYTLLKIDAAKAQEELLYLALQTARIILLKNKTIPRTKHEISGQLKKFNKEIAEITQELLEKKQISKEKMLEYISTCKTQEQ